MKRSLLTLLLSSSLSLTTVIADLPIETPTMALSPYQFGQNANGKQVVLKSGNTFPVFFICGTNGDSAHLASGFNTIFYELYADNSPESLGKSYDELKTMWTRDLEEIAEKGYSVIIYIHNHNHGRDRLGYFPFNEDWKKRVTWMVETFKGLPNLAGWAFADEPSDHIGYPVHEYRTFLKEKYQTIEALNTAWQAKHASFDEITLLYKDKEGGKGNGIPLPELYSPSYPLGVSRVSFDAADYKLWRVRRAHEIFETTVRAVDAKTPLWSGAHNLAWAATQVPSGWGTWCDAYPTYSGDDWYTHHAWFQSILRGQNYRPVVPMLMIETSNADLARKWNLSPKVWGGWMVQGALQGASGIAFWPWSLLGEAHSPGEVADASERREFCGETLRSLEQSGIFSMKPDNTIAVLYQPYAEGWSGQSQVYGLLAKTGDTPLGLIESLTFGTRYGSVDYLTNESIKGADLDSYGVIMAPMAADIPADLQRRLTEYVQKGGILIADMGFSSKNAEGHLASMTPEAKALFGLSNVKVSRMEGQWKVAETLPKRLAEAGVSAPAELSLRAQLSVEPTTAQPVLEGNKGQGLFVQSHGKGEAYFYSGALWSREMMANEVIRELLQSLFANRAKIAKKDNPSSANANTPAMMNSGYQLFKYTTGYAATNLDDVAKTVAFEIDGVSRSVELPPRGTTFFDGKKNHPLGAAFVPAPALLK